MRRIKGAFDVGGFVAEDNSGLADKNSRRSVLGLELTITFYKERNPSPEVDARSSE